ncbi:MAG: BlaI/MecI/CopY family transcriptional regulator [Armatimonadota bacterium]|nr:BlaI/MecI/CopY family transcriptional regulator [Armatimonadota bacterium]MDR7444330.1 BlaI/MecI/CopY family transcriptional regulator [Armatimonadota bacterium]MDR7569679.1 BlaI/MecI/CopY family transcriptional regulator [Armatimonadota bacterium]MDR7614817.1 BlaI/MecI/CopY family transcriptional regulator [Armatimonadota bacterium]
MTRPREEPELHTVRLDRPGIRSALGDLEAEIMEVIWSRPPGEGVTVREVFEELYRRRRLAYTTVMNTMARLARKGLLVAERREPAYVYRAALQREAFIERFVGRVLERLLVNFGGVAAEKLRELTDPGTRQRLLRLAEEARARRPGR